MFCFYSSTHLLLYYFYIAKYFHIPWFDIDDIGTIRT